MSAVTALLAASPAVAQTIPDAPRTDRDPLASSYSAEFLQDLPTSDNLFNAIDILQPTIIADRFTGGGLSTGQPARLGGFLSSWTQTLFTIDGVSFTDPTGNGFPMLSPELMFWSNVRVATGGFRGDNPAQGLSIELTPPTPDGAWTGRFEGALSQGRMNATGSADLVPSVSRLSGYGRAGFTTSGLFRSGKVGATLAGSATNASQFERRDATSVDGRVFSAFGQLRFAPSDANDIRLIGWGQKTEVPLPFRHILSTPEATQGATGAHTQITWRRRANPDRPWLLSASVSERRDTPSYANATSGILERMTDGPVSQFASLAKQTVRAWSASARVDPRLVSGDRVHRVSAGVQGSGGQQRSSESFQGAIGELVYESPARVWQFSAPSTPSNRRTTALAAFVQDDTAVGERLRLRGGLRFETVRGSATGAAQGINWNSLLPHAGLELSMTGSGKLLLFSSYTRSARRLTTDLLAVGDPNAPTALVSRWTALAGYPLSVADRGAAITRVGPGTGGNPALSTIAADLKRPTADEFVVGVEGQPFNGVLLRFTGITRQERNLMALTNVGTPSYTTFTVDDPGGDVLDPIDDRTLTVYNRNASSFMKDLFQLSNGQNGSFSGIEITIQFQTKHVTFSGGGTAGIAETYANNVGFGPLENDQYVLGDAFSNPNANAYAFGRSFTDRAFTGKIATVFRLPAETRLGLVARYMDGQPFARVVVFPGLNQGAEPIRAFANGDSRFKFVGTLDLRLQKTFRAGTHRVDGFIDGYNVLNMRLSVEEDVANLPDVRPNTALQPPLSMHAGVRVGW